MSTRKKRMDLKAIIEAFQDRQELILSERYDELKKRKSFKPVDLDALEKFEESQVKIQTGTILDKLIGGGLLPSESMLLFGEYGSGKSQTVYTMMVRCPDHVIIIDSEHTVKMTRLKQIATGLGMDWQAVKKNITLFKPEDWLEQLFLLDHLPSPADVGKIGIIICDSLSKLFRDIEFAGRQTLMFKQPLIRMFLLRIERIIKDYECAFVLTTQIYEDPNANVGMAAWTRHKATGGASLLHQPEYVVFLRRGEGSVRIAQLRDSSNQPLGERAFQITTKGIEDLPQTPKAKEVIEKIDKRTIHQQDPLALTPSQLKAQQKKEEAEEEKKRLESEAEQKFRAEEGRSIEGEQ